MIRPTYALLGGAAACALAAAANAHTPPTAHGPAPTAAAASPDIIPDPHDPRRLARAIRFDLGPFEGAALRKTQVKKGDTYFSLARTRYGAADAAAQIAALNPGVDSRKLTIGSWLWMPPRDRTQDARAAVAAFAVTDGDRLQPLADVAPVTLAHAETTKVRLVLAPATQLPALAADPRLPADWRQRGYRVVDVDVGKVAHQDVPYYSPARFQAIPVTLEEAEGVLSLRPAPAIFLDANHQVVDAKTALAVSPYPKQGAVWVLLAGVLGSGLMARRRRRADAPA